MNATKSKMLSLYLELNKHIEKFVQQIIVRGFSKIGDGSYKSVYSKNKLGYVIKIADSLNDEFAELPSDLQNFYIKPYYIDNQIVIQERANTKLSQKSYKKIHSILGDERCVDLDIYKQNCGMLRGKPVVFDFASI